MIKTVFGTKAVLAIAVFLALACAANIYIAVSSYTFVDNFFESESFRQYYILFFDLYNSSAEYNIEDIYIGFKYLMNFVGFIFITLAVGNAWEFAGAMTIYISSKNPSPNASPRSGFTVIQAFSITKLVIEIVPTLFMLLALCAVIQESSIRFSYILVILFICFNIVKSIGLITAVSSVKRTIDGRGFSSGGCGALQFSSCAVGSVILILSLLSLISMMSPTTIDPSIPEIVVNDILSIKSFVIFCTIFGFVLSIINFLLFVIAKHYAKKLPIAVNAQYVYHSNMSNLYPDTYNNISQPSPTYHQQYPQSPYNSNNPNHQYYQSPPQPYSPDSNTYPPYQGNQPYYSPTDNNNNNPPPNGF